MRCHRARRILELRESQGLDPRRDRMLKEHLAVCRDCAALIEQIDRTWNLMAHHPTVEPSPDFLPHLRARLRAESQSAAGARKPRPAIPWHWAAAAAFVLLAGVLLLQHESGRTGGPVVARPDQTLKAAADHDRFDEQFLEDLDQTLRHSEADYLSTYDLWPVLSSEAGPFEASKGAASGRNLRKKENS